MTGDLYRWPSAARFGRTVPKAKLYEHGRVSSSLRDRIVAQVGRVEWAFKLAESTIHLPGSTSVPEIQVFRVQAKREDVSDAVLAAIDRAVLTPIVFEVVRGEDAGLRTRMAAAYKQLGSGAPKVGPLYTTDWLDDAARVPMPVAIDLPSLYSALLEPLTPLAARPGEGVSEVVARLVAVRALEREIATLERRLRAEPQLNRKVEKRRALKAKQAELGDLVGPAPEAGDSRSTLAATGMTGRSAGTPSHPATERPDHRHPASSR